MGRRHSNVNGRRRPQASKRSRDFATGDLDLMVRFTASRDRDREGMGR